MKKYRIILGAFVASMCLNITIFLCIYVVLFKKKGIEFPANCI